MHTRYPLLETIKQEFLIRFNPESASLDYVAEALEKAKANLASVQDRELGAASFLRGASTVGAAEEFSDVLLYGGSLKLLESNYRKRIEKLEGILMDLSSH